MRATIACLFFVATGISFAAEPLKKPSMAPAREPIVSVSDTKPNKQADWTLMFYMNGTRILESSAIQDINEAETVGSNQNVNVLMQIARARGLEGDSVAQGDWTGVRRYYVTKGKTRRATESQLVQDLGAADMGDWNQLADFISWSKANYPAKKYMLVIWGHGYGWKPLEKHNADKILPRNKRLRGVSDDGYTGNEISIQQVGKAIQKSGGNISALAFDTCLTMTAEVAYELRNDAKVIMGSEEAEPGSVRRYGRIIKFLQDNPHATAKGIAKEWVASYAEFFRKNNSGTVVTQSALDTSKLDRFKDLFNNWTDAVLNSWDERVMRQAKRKARRFWQREYRDLVDVVLNISQNSDSPRVKATAAELIEYMNDELMLANFARTKKAHGLTLYVPSRKYTPIYDNMAFAADTRWPELAKKLAKLTMSGKEYESGPSGDLDAAIQGAEDEESASDPR